MSTRIHRTAGTPRRARGISLVEALVALVVMAVGMLSLAQVQKQLRFNAEISRQRAEAVRFAQADLERWRAFAVLDTTAGVRDYADIVTQAATAMVGEENLNTTYRLTRSVTDSAAPAYKILKVTVDWRARNNELFQIELDSLISKTSPSLTGQVNTPPVGTISRNPLNRNIRIPTSAVNLGNDKSGFRPPGQSSGYYVLNNLDATVIEYCTGALTAADYAFAQSSNGCQTSYGYTVSGFINFDLRNNNISAIDPGSTVCDFYADLQATGLMTTTPPTLDINSVVINQAMLGSVAGGAGIAVGDYHFNVLTLNSANSTPPDYGVSVSATNNLIVTLGSSTNTNFNQAFFSSLAPIVLRVKGTSTPVETFTPTSINNFTSSNTYVRSGDNTTPSPSPQLVIASTRGQLTLDPTVALLANTIYELVIPASSITLRRNSGGNPTDTNTSDVTLTFSTGTAPTLSTSNPASATEIPSLSSDVVLTFDRNIVVAAASAITLYKRNANGIGWSAIPASVTVSGSTLTVNPTADLVTGAIYSVEIGNGAIRDTNGFSYAGLVLASYTFTTAASTVSGSCPTTNAGVLNYMEVRTADSANATTQSGTQFGGAWPYTIESTPSGAKAVCYADSAATVVNQTARAIGYFCVVYMTTNTPFTWSGKINLWGPDEWLSGANSQYKVCRYHDNDNNGTDTNLEHPAVYTAVDKTITDQNFLIIRKNGPGNTPQLCPNETLVIGSVGNPNATVYFNTAPYQP